MKESLFYLQNVNAQSILLTGLRASIRCMFTIVFIDNVSILSVDSEYTKRAPVVMPEPSAFEESRENNMSNHTLRAVSGHLVLANN